MCVYVSSAKAESIGQIGTPDEQQYVIGFFLFFLFSCQIDTMTPFGVVKGGMKPV